MVELKAFIDKIKSCGVVESWLKDLSHNSKVGYLSALAEFCMVNQIDPEGMLKIIYEEEQERLPSWERSVNRWFEAYDEHCKLQNHTRKTRDIRRTIVNAFISFHGLPRYSRRGGHRKVEGLKEANHRKHLTKQDINELLEFCRSFKMKAIILTQISSGLAVADVQKLKIKDFQKGLIKLENGKICRLNLKRKKTGVEFTTFMSMEAVEAIERYLEFERVDPQPEDALFSSFKSGKPLTIGAFQQSYRNLNRYAGWKSEKGKFRRATSHMMRKFFNTQLINAGMPEEIREHMMGHTLKDKVREAYFLADPTELQKVYLTYMSHVTIKNFEPEKSVDSSYDKRMSEMEAVILEIKNKMGE